MQLRGLRNEQMSKEDIGTTKNNNIKKSTRKRLNKEEKVHRRTKEQKI